MKLLKNFLVLITTSNSFRHPGMIITSIHPDFQSLILSKFLLPVFAIITLSAVTGIFINSSHVIHYISDQIHLKNQMCRNQTLNKYYHYLPDSIDRFINHLLTSDSRLTQNKTISIKTELFSRLQADWHIFAPTVAIMHPFCCPGFTNSDTIVTMIKMLFKSIPLSQLHSFTCPASGWISSGFGMRTDPVFEGTAFHKGVDIAAPAGTPVFCTADGVVIFCGWKPLLGNAIFIRLNQTNLITIYGHLQNIRISRNDSVFQGQIIGHAGSTGKSTGPHLHFEVRLGDIPINPISLLLPLDTLID